jgi:hypothetical protein
MNIFFFILTINGKAFYGVKFIQQVEPLMFKGDETNKISTNP